ncbi:MAG: trypsin-like peptidase domain-containing protein [Patescibacteria group bacterium]
MQQSSLSLPVIILTSLLVGLVGGYGGSYLYSQTASVTRGFESLQSDTKKPSILRGSEEEAVIAAVKKTSPSVVSIVVSKDLSKILNRTGPDIAPFDNFFEFGFPFNFKFTPNQQKGGEQNDAPKGKQRIGGGSGFIISEDGLIVTNRHVITDDEAEYTVITNDGKEYPAKVLAKDPVNDLALVKIDAKALTALMLGDSGDIQIGQTVIAIGYTLGEYKNTVTRGVVSGINRVVQASDGMGETETIQEAIQTDAAINPGNSGGPLLNLAGEVIGINTAMNSQGQSIGFAIPINIAKRSVESVKKNGKIIRPWLGVRYIPVDSIVKEKNNLSVDYGALIIGNAERKELGVIKGSPAEKAGLSEGDIILKVNGQKIDDGHSLAHEIAKYSPGDEVKVVVESKGKEKELTVKLEEFKEQKK